jgi:CRISPR-associated endonuclease/helicase Cas3
MSALTLADFRAFFRAVHDGHDPFPWQVRLADRLLNGDAWPQPIALPTGSGKTTALDLAVFHLAAQADLPPCKRSAARRIFYVVDRRVVVDEAYDHACALAAALSAANPGILAAVAARLRGLAADPGEEADPLLAAQLRGGVYRDHAWARTPTQPTIVCTTVDQLGSRLLFRGYGVSPAARPIHAALAAHDALILLDEAHLAQPFLETLSAVRDYRAQGQGLPPGPFAVVVLSATPPAADGNHATAAPFGLGSDAHGDDFNDPVLGPRLRASKPVRLHVAAKARGKNFVEPLAQELVRQAEVLVKDARRAIGLFANRVATARAAAALLRERFNDKADVLLFTGRMRPCDRDALAEAWLSRLRPTATPRTLDRPVFVVATQTLEVGANLDFDALVTECASLDALRQRFGRLNRGGRPGESPPAVIVVRADQAEPDTDKPDPVYGTALSETWQWLQAQVAQGALDFGIAALQPRLKALNAKERQRLNVPPAHAPVLLPAHLDCWAQTAPEPRPSPDVSLFLHGPGRGEPDALVCWRADLPGEAGLDVWTDVLSLCPPAASECVSVPVWRLRQWLADDPTESPDSADAPGVTPAAPADPRQFRPRFRVLRWHGADDSAFLDDVRDLRPGDLLVLPAEAGPREQLADFPPGSPLDMGDPPQLLTRARPVLRLHPELLKQWPESPARDDLIVLVAPEADAPLAERLETPAFVADLRDALTQLAETEKERTKQEVERRREENGLTRLAETEKERTSWLARSAEWLARELRSKSRARRVLFLHPAGGLILRAVRRVPGSLLASDETVGEDDSASATVPVGLLDHSRGVAKRARRYARACGLPDPVQAALELAGWLHDTGKADPRFQMLLRSGARGAGFGELLAKSGGLPLPPAARRELARRAGYPPGARHELLSVRFAEALLSQLPGNTNPAPNLTEDERRLVLHLIAATHGYCRPLAPVVQDDQPVNVSLHWPPAPDSPAAVALQHSSATGLEHLGAGVADRFWSLIRRHGWWGLAFLETLLLLADHRQSEAEQRNQDAAP